MLSNYIRKRYYVSTGKISLKFADSRFRLVYLHWIICLLVKCLQYI